MGKLILSLVAVLTCVTLPMATLDGEQPPSPGSLDCLLGTMPYTANEHGLITLPAGIEWQVLPHYTSISDDGSIAIDNRITVVLNDSKNSFYPLVVRMNLKEAARLNEQLSSVIADKISRDTESK